MNNVLERIKNRIPPYKKRMIRMSIDIGAQIFEYMKSDGINQRELADKLGKRESEISKWLSGSHNFTIETISKIEEVFGKKIVLVPMFAEDDLIMKTDSKSAKKPVKRKLFDNALSTSRTSYNSSASNQFGRVSENISRKLKYGRKKVKK